MSNVFNVIGLKGEAPLRSGALVQAAVDEAAHCLQTCSVKVRTLDPSVPAAL